MKKVSFSGSLRENVGKKDASLLRREGRVPSVIYGGENQIHFHLAENDAKKLVFTPNVYIVELNVDGTKKKAIIQEVQQHPVTDRITHIDFLEVREGAPVKIKIPVALEGFSVGVRNGGKLRQNFRKLTVEGLEADLPDNVVVNITNVKIGGKVRVNDLSVNGLRFLDPAGAVVVAVQMARGAKMTAEEEEAEEAAAEAAAEEAAAE